MTPPPKKTLPGRLAINKERCGRAIFALRTKPTNIPSANLPNVTNEALIQEKIRENGNAANSNMPLAYHTNSNTIDRPGVYPCSDT